MTSPPDLPRTPSSGDGPQVPDGPARVAWFDGVLTGVRDGSDLPQCSAEAVRAAGVGLPSVEIDGGRFSLLLDATPFDPRRAVPSFPSEVEAALRALVVSSPNPASVSSTVRCTEVFADVVRETAFLTQGGALHRLERVRPADDVDRRRFVPGAEPLPFAAAASLGRRRLLAIGVLSAALFTAVVWQGGLVDRLFAPEVAAMTLDTGPFGGAVVVSAESSFGRYEVKIRRGAAYPRTAEDAAALTLAAGSPAARAAAATVIEGGAIFVRLESEDGKTLRSATVSLRALLVGDDGVVEASIPARLGAKRLTLAMDAGR